MDNEVKQSADLYDAMAWAHANRTKLISIVLAVAVIGGVIGLYIWHKNSNETAAADALSLVKPPASTQPGVAPSPADARGYLKVAEDYPGTHAAARALIMAGGALFEAGKFDQAKDAFDKFLRDYSDSPSSTQALLGVAASLEASGKTAEALSRYDDLVKRHPTDPVIPQAKSAQARLYVAQNKPDQAVRIYEELAKVNNNDSYSAEASIQLEELLAKNPNLRKPVVPTPNPTSSSTVTVPPLK